MEHLLQLAPPIPFPSLGHPLLIRTHILPLISLSLFTLLFQIVLLIRRIVKHHFLIMIILSTGFLVLNVLDKSLPPVFLLSHPTTTHLLATAILPISLPFLVVHLLLSILN